MDCALHASKSQNLWQLREKTRLCSIQRLLLRRRELRSNINCIDPGVSYLPTRDLSNPNSTDVVQFVPVTRLTGRHQAVRTASAQSRKARGLCLAKFELRDSLVQTAPPIRGKAWFLHEISLKALTTARRAQHRNWYLLLPDKPKDHSCWLSQTLGR